MYSLKFAHLVKEKTDAQVYNFYIDIRAFGKGYEEFYERILEEEVQMIRGKVAEVTDQLRDGEPEGKLIIEAENTLLGEKQRIPVDMVILSTALEPNADTKKMAQIFRISRSGDGFFLEKHPKLGPVETATAGVYLAGACQSPKDIPDTVAQASAASASVFSVIQQGKVKVDPAVAEISEELCSGCQLCVSLCPYQAISFNKEKEVSEINEALCKGCGTCAAACPSNAITAKHFYTEKIFAEIKQALGSEKSESRLGEGGESDEI